MPGGGPVRLYLEQSLKAFSVQMLHRGCKAGKWELSVSWNIILHLASSLEWPRVTHLEAR